LYVFPHTEITASTSSKYPYILSYFGNSDRKWIIPNSTTMADRKKISYISNLTSIEASSKNILLIIGNMVIGYFMSSFHTLAVGLLLSWFYPTTAGYYFVWVWWLSMTLVEILLIVPSSLGNSALHKISHKTDVEKRTSIGSLMSLIWIVWGLVALNFYRFSDIIITFVSGTKYLSSTLWWIWSDIILWFLGIVLLLTFTKQVFNYMFIATDHQNKLFSVNTRWVIFWIGFASRAVYHFGLVGGIAGQLFVEALYVIGAIWIAYRNKVMPIINKKIIWLTIAWVAGWCLLAYGLHYYQVFWTNQFINLTIIWVYNLLLFGSIFKLTKKIMRGI
jgi:O-antigen/teichoic acid export membrane protein